MIAAGGTTGATRKMIYLGTRNPALAAEAFPGTWKQHAVLSATVASAVIGMAQCSRVLDNEVLPGARPPMTASAS